MTLDVVTFVSSYDVVVTTVNCIEKLCDEMAEIRCGGGDMRSGTPRSHSIWISEGDHPHEGRCGHDVMMGDLVLTEDKVNL